MGLLALTEFCIQSLEQSWGHETPYDVHSSIDSFIALLYCEEYWYDIIIASVQEDNPRT